MDTYDHVTHDARETARKLRRLAAELEEDLGAHDAALADNASRTVVAASLLRRYARALHALQNYVGAQGHTDPEHLVNMAAQLAAERGAS